MTGAPVRSRSAAAAAMQANRPLRLCRQDGQAGQAFQGLRQRPEVEGRPTEAETFAESLSRLDDVAFEAGQAAQLVEDDGELDGLGAALSTEGERLVQVAARVRRFGHDRAVREDDRNGAAGAELVVEGQRRVQVGGGLVVAAEGGCRHAEEVEGPDAIDLGAAFAREGQASPARRRGLVELAFHPGEDARGLRGQARGSRAR